MCPSEQYPDDEEQLRKALTTAAPKPSEQHNDSVMTAARRIAAERHAQAPDRDRWKPVIGLAASLFVAFAAVWLLRTEPPETSYQRSTANPDIVPADGSVIDAQPQRFSWSEIEAAPSLRVKLFNDRALLVWQSPITYTSEVPLSTDLELDSGARYFWVVEPAENASTATLGPYWFSLE